VKELIILGGPNGAGKTTAAPVVLADMLGIREFVNADEIARGLSPFNADGAAVAAGRLMIARIRSLMRAGESLAFETTCAGRMQLALIRDARALGYRATLVFLWLPSPDDALARVAGRVRQGGHGVPDAVVIRRYWTGLRNMRHAYLPAVDDALVYDNSDRGRVLIAERLAGGRLVVRDRPRWAKITKATR
jgi:predicted ABC-type ATPase